MLKRLSFLALAATTLATSVAAETYVIDRKHSEASFQVRHFVTKVRGRFKEFDGTINLDKANPAASSVQFTIKTASIDTDIAQRDGHLRSADFFDAEKFPEITFKSTKVVKKDDTHFEVTGPLTLHGVTKEITVPVTFLGFANQEAKAGFEVSATLNRKDYGVVWNKTLDTGGMMLGEEVFVTITIEADKQQQKAAAPAA